MASSLVLATPAAMRTSLHGRRVGLDDNGNLVKLGIPYSVLFAPAAGASNVCTLTMTVVDYLGNTIAGVFNLDFWLSDATSGAGLTSHAPTSTTTASTGAIVGVLTTDKFLRVQTAATGIAVLSITDTGKSATIPCAQITADSGAIVGAALTTGNYG